MRKILLDTNAYAGFLAGDKTVLIALGEADQVFMPVFVLGELFFGFRAGQQERKNKEILQRFLQKPGVAILEGSRETAEIFGMIKSALKKSGHPIPINDVWIAAHTLEAGAILVTYDTHFTAVPGLRIWDGLSV